jgi:hypothetical protein
LDFYLTDSSGKKLLFPMNPATVDVARGPTVETYTVLSLGQISVPRGRNPHAVSWSGILPGEGSKEQPFVKAWQPASTVDTQLIRWLDSQDTLKLLITSSPIVMNVYISNYQSTYGASFGNINYSIELTERRSLIVSTSNPSTGPSKVNTGKLRTKPATPFTYTIKAGDSLWIITKKYVTPSTANINALYTLNKSVIGPNPNLIKAGQTLRIPSGW